MLNKDKRIKAIVDARRTCAGALLNSLRQLSKVGFSEKELATKWLSKIRNKSNVRHSGWYCPPADGISVLIGNAPNYSRLVYESLRDTENFPKPDVCFLDNAILYPYFSAVDKKSLLLGDFVGTFYGGKDQKVIDWICLVYKTTLKIAEFVDSGKKVSEIYEYAEKLFNALGVKNNTYSQIGGLSADIGHSIPGFEVAFSDNSITTDESVSTLIANHRWFVSKNNDKILGEDFGVTIEPQLFMPELPMVSFHIIVVSVNKKKRLITEYDSLFEYFGMNYLTLLK